MPGRKKNRTPNYPSTLAQKSEAENPVPNYHNTVFNPLYSADDSNLIVNFIPSEMDDESLMALFSKLGIVASCRIVKDKSGATRGYGFVKYLSVESAQECLRTMNGYEIYGKRLRVSVARPTRPELANPPPARSQAKVASAGGIDATSTGAPTTAQRQQQPQSHAGGSTNPILHSSHIPPIPTGVVYSDGMNMHVASLPSSQVPLYQAPVSMSHHQQHHHHQQQQLPSYGGQGVNVVQHSVSQPQGPSTIPMNMVAHQQSFYPNAQHQHHAMFSTSGPNYHQFYQPPSQNSPNPDQTQSQQ